MKSMRKNSKARKKRYEANKAGLLRELNEVLQVASNKKEKITGGAYKGTGSNLSGTSFYSSNYLGGY